MQGKWTIPQVILCIAAVALLVVAIVMGVRVAGLVQQTSYEASLTPTPVPPYGNVMQVTVDPSAPTPEPVLRSGSQGEDVRRLQERLQELGYYTGTVDGQFGPGTREAVTLFQSQHGLGADGTVGQETRTVLYSDKAHQVIVTPTPTQAPATQTPPPSSGAEVTGLLRSGDSGEQVAALQERLKELGYYTGAVDGQFGEGTRKAVKTFQRLHQLDDDGVVGEATRKRLFSDDAMVITLQQQNSVVGRIPGVDSTGELVLVNRANKLPDNYKVSELVNMSTYCDSSIVKIKHDGTLGERMAVDALMVMLRAAHKDGLTVWQVSSAYRSVAEQEDIFEEQVQAYMNENGLSRSAAASAARQTVADPGCSEHHLGVAFDLTVPGEFFKDTKQSVWLAENCWTYGFILRYQADKEDITGYLAEPWHVRYVGTEHSLYMYQHNLCLEEYLQR